MYTIIGGDGREYGPVTAEQVRSWMAGGRANLETKIKVAGSFDWKTIADFPEIVSPPASGGGSGDALVPPAALAVPGAAVAARDFDVMSCYERSWKLLKANFWPFVGMAVVMVVFGLPLGFFAQRTHGLLSWLVGAPLGAGFYYYILLKVRGQPAAFGDLFAGFTRNYLQVVLATLVGFVITMIGFVCLILPGIYLLVAYAFSNLLITDKKVAFWDGLEASRKTVTRHWWSVFGLLLLGIPFLILGAACLGVGILVAVPFIMGAVTYAYEDLFGSVA